MIERRLIEVEGIVQGVGFRPFVHNLATAHDLHGFVYNDIGGLLIDVQGDTSALESFLESLTGHPPPLAVISRVASKAAQVREYRGFSIAPSAPLTTERSPITAPAIGAARPRTFVSPDVATCDHCLAELFDFRDRRYLYPFINCTHCGPRFTIIRQLPYDRPHTTMRLFEMCDDCRDEYEDPADRRFHAQPIACPTCGPRVELVLPVREAEPLEDDLPATDISSSAEHSGNAIENAARALAAGRIVGIKGLGGYHIACDAMNVESIARLRARKHREAKPFALMALDLEVAARLCRVDHAEADLLLSPERPIVLLSKRDDVTAQVVEALDAVAPRNGFVGVMLPYTPLHHLLMSAFGGPLVMTSGNLTDEPIAFEDDDAGDRLSPIVDLMLTHDRPIATRCDDSVMRVMNGAPVFVRRSRGFAPRPVNSVIPFPAHVLAVGGHLKNTFCLARDYSAFVSHHVGDLENAAAYGSLEKGIDHYCELVGVRPEIVAHDLHPGYLSTQLANTFPPEQRIEVQHHHAHIASCMAEHGLTDPVIGVAFDGAGLGDDGAIWGGEFLVVDAAGYRRAAHLAYVPLPGGDAAVRHPIRMAIAHACAALGTGVASVPGWLTNRVPGDQLALLDQMLSKRIASPPTSSVGRLFDAIAAILGVRDEAQFEGQAAMELEAIADTDTTRSYHFDVGKSRDLRTIDASPLIRAVLGDVEAGRPSSEIAGAFHNSIAGMILDLARSIREETGINSLALSGGVFQNRLLSTRSSCALETAGFDVFMQRLVPCNDGGLSLGQAYVVALGATAAAGKPRLAGT